MIKECITCDKCGDIVGLVEQATAFTKIKVKCYNCVKEEANEASNKFRRRSYLPYYAIPKEDSKNET